MNASIHRQQESFKMDVWDKNMNGSKYVTTTFPAAIFKRRFKKPAQSKARWYIIIGVSIAIIVIAIAVIALAIHFALDDGEAKFHDNEMETFQLGRKSTTVFPEPQPTSVANTPKQSKPTTIQLKTSLKQTRKSTLMTTHHSDTTKSNTQKTTGINTIHTTKKTPAEVETIQTTKKTPNPTEEKTRQVTTVSSPSTSKDSITSTASAPDHNHQSGSSPHSVPTSTSIVTTSTMTTTKSSRLSYSTTHSSAVSSASPLSTTLPTSTESRAPATMSRTSILATLSSSAPWGTKERRTVSTTLPVTNTALSTIAPATPNHTVLSFENTNITLPFMGSPLTMKCVALYAQDWVDLKVVRHVGNEKLSIALITSGVDYPSVYVIDSNFSSEVSYKQDALMVTLSSNSVDCSYVTDYSCLISTPKEVKEVRTTVHAVHSHPKLVIPTSIVEGEELKLKCSTEILGRNGTLKWKLKPPGLQTYYDLSLTPTTTTTRSGCSVIMESVLTFNPQMHDNGSFYRCEVNEMEDAGIIPTLYSEEEFYVVPKSFCDDKTIYSINEHPFRTCDMVIYCYMDGPRVYQIDCDPGSCYDINKTKCVAIV